MTTVRSRVDPCRELEVAHRRVDRVGIAKVAVDSLDRDAIDGAVVATGTEQDTYFVAIVKQAVHEVGAQVTTGTGEEDFASRTTAGRNGTHRL